MSGQYDIWMSKTHIRLSDYDGGTAWSKCVRINQVTKKYDKHHNIGSPNKSETSIEYIYLFKSYRLFVTLNRWATRILQDDDTETPY